MANPNLLTMTSVQGKSTNYAITTSTTSLITAGSNTIIKINSVIVANVNGSSAADVTVSLFKNQTTDFRFAFTVSVPADTSLVVISKDSFIYLEENDSIRFTASANSFLEALVSYEVVGI
jgi:hypothetical protein